MECCQIIATKPFVQHRSGRPATRGAGRRPLIWLERAVMNVAGAAAGDYDEWAIKSISSRSPLADRPAWLAIYSWGCPRKSREP